ncbi:DUF917 domain-containing protein [Bacterioplanoides sp.]|uniref:DUF917 domain-containing protein n=1 Tax=Bacterioplanoides sp. TaxID=2066072 RepID=UPI003AFFC065
MPHESSLDSKLVTLEDMKALIYGGCFLASGGGGPISMALNFHQRISSPVPMISKSDLNPGEKVAIVADLGSPDKAAEGFGYTAPVNAYTALDAYLLQQEQKKISYFLPAEIGAVNTLIPFFIASQFSPPLTVVNADPSGRAVPEMDESMLEVNNVPCCPAIIASDTQSGKLCQWSQGNFISKLFTNLTPSELEDAARQEVSQPVYNQVGGMACWPMDSDFLASGAADDAVIEGSVQAAIQVGHTLLNNPAPEHLAETLTGLGIYWHVLCNGLITKIDNRTASGFDVGKIVLKTMMGELWVYYKNESLLAWDPQEKQPKVIAPDCINFLKFSETDQLYGTQPVSTADIAEGQVLTVWATACADKMRNPTIESMFLKDIHQINAAFPEDHIEINTYIPVEQLNS